VPGTVSFNAAAGMAGGLEQVWCLSATGRVPEALALGHQLQRAATQAGDQPGRAACCRLLAFCSLQSGLIDEGLDQARTAGRLYQTLNDLAGEANARALYAWLLMQRADSDIALDEALQALALARQQPDKLTLGYALNVTGIVYWQIKQPDKALPFLEESVEIARQLHDDLHIGRFMSNLSGAQAELGLVAQERGDINGFNTWLRAAIATAEAALEIAQSMQDVWGARVLLCNLAECFCQIGDFTNAQRYLDAFAETSGPLLPREAVHHHYTRGLVFMGMGRLGEAIAAFEASLTTENDGDIEQAVMSTQQLAHALEAAGRHPEALAAFKRYHALYVRLTEQAVQRRARIAALGFENDKLRAQAAAEQRRAQILEDEKLSLLRETERLTRTVMEDGLTMLPNRRHLEDALFTALASGEHYVIGMIDVDHFKQINDSHSHLAGDEVLRQIAVILRHCCRENDLPARYGGEEFAVLLRLADLTAGKRICERIRAAIASHNWLGELQIPKVTVSIGIASSGEATTPNRVMELADKRLYLAKAMGRNLVVDTDA